MPDNFAAFIITHGRPNRVLTYNALQKHGYTGKVYIVIYNEDNTAEEYHRIFGDKVLVYDKKAIAGITDIGDNRPEMTCVTYPRNACFEMAKKVGVRYFIQLDDDYKEFAYKYDSSGQYIEKPIVNLDGILSAILRYFQSIHALSISMAQCGDFIGGQNNGLDNSIWRRRKCMNTFICDVERPFKFFGRMNEDVSTYTNTGSRGGLFLTVTSVAIHQLTTQVNPGGMSDVYADSGTYVKSFYSVMYQPSSISIKMMGTNHRRLHHRINWKRTVPAIIREEYRK